MNYKVSPQSIGLNPEQAEHAARAMNHYLANLQVLFIKFHNVHWNVIGPSFFEIHEKTQVLYEHVAEEIDLIAERIKMIGFYPVGSLKDALKLATIKELPSKVDLNGPTVASIVVKDLRKLIAQLREISQNVDSAYTGGLIEDALSYYEKQHWLFSAYLTKE
ncbi:MAG: DNA starvation/stationary phase protection protein [Bacillaceae bacterium]|nr:DNA starvation/stationary phase protection protein [Bacillaceae bacterium]